MAKKTAKSVGTSRANQGNQGKLGGQDKKQKAGAIDLLKADHRKVEELFKKYEQQEDDDQKQEIAQQICQELIIHSMLEEEIFYPACRQKAGTDEDAKQGLDEAQVEHDGAKTLINELLTQSPDSEFYDAKVTVLAEYIKHHVGEEEKPSDGIFAKAQKAGIDMDALGQRLQARKTELMEQAEADRLRAPMPRSLHIGLNQEDEYMAQRSNYRERDEYGRFTSDDDDRGYRSRSSSSRGSSRYDDDDDNRGRGRGQGGWFGDSEGHSQAARSRGGSRRSSSRYEDDDDDGRGHGRGGWFGDSEGHSQAARSRGGGSRRSSSRYEDDDDGRGWYGDPEGHSEASRRGWESRGGGRYDDDDDRSYRSRSARSRGGSRYEDDDEGQGGWFGDPEGHSEAARRGWESRGGGRSRSRDDDDDDRGGRGRGRGQGGWFGDPEGHSEASRRGWRNRD